MNATITIPTAPVTLPRAHREAHVARRLAGHPHELLGGDVGGDDGDADQPPRQVAAGEEVRLAVLLVPAFEVYGTSIPPDATFTLRISDGVVKGYDYNATEAPVFTTFYGMYDRYHSFDKKFPWSFPERWQNPPEEFDLETPFNFITTNDIIGGNSGSPIINQNAEIVGLAFDGNIESLPGNFIYTPEKNRCVGVHSSGMIEAIRDMYKATRLSDELLSGKIILVKEQLDEVAQ